MHNRMKCGVMAVLLGIGVMACGSGATDSATRPVPDEQRRVLLAQDEVEAIMRHAARAVAQLIAVAVTDRRGVILGVATNFGSDRDEYPAQCLTACPATDFAINSASDCAVVNLAVQLARTAAFFSANETPLTSRSIRFLSGEHFPPGIRNTAAAALFGIENTNRGCSFDTAPDANPPIAAEFQLLDGGDPLRRVADVRIVPRARHLAAELDPALRCESAADAAARCGCTSGIATLPGGVPVYKNGVMVGGIGVALRGVNTAPDPVAAFDAPSIVLRRSDAQSAYAIAELAARAFAGGTVCQDTLGIQTPVCCTQSPSCSFSILPSLPSDVEPVIFIDGIEIPEVDPDPPVGAVGAGTTLPANDRFIVGPRASDDVVASQWLVVPRDANPPAEPLSAQEVKSIIDAGVAEAYRIRAAIRLPLQQRSAMVVAVADTTGALLGVYRMPDATVFSIDVAVAKARNVTYFSGPTVAPIDLRDCPSSAPCSGQPFLPPLTAVTNRTIGFAAQPFFPSGIDGVDDAPHFSPGPFRRVFLEDSAVPCTNGRQPSNGRQDGVVFFPGSAPLYRNGILIGGLGVSGDGVEQDDIVTVAGTQASPGFEAPPAIRADQIVVRGVRLPYVKANRQPEQ